MSYHWHDVLGNVGVATILGTYLALQIERLDARTPLYSVLNGVGAGLITLSLCFDFNLSAFVVEVAWVAVSLYGLVRALRTQR